MRQFTRARSAMTSQWLFLETRIFMSIKISHLSKLYGSQHAVDDISFEAQKGEVLGFLGPNGAGKSTTMKIITGFIPQSEGSVTVCGHDVQQEPLEVKKRVGYLPENNPLYYEMYVHEYLEFVARVHKLGSGTKSRISEMIEVTGLSSESKKKIGQLSKGYKQRVGIAQAMLHDPEVLILDEPTAGLDPNQLLEIRALIQSLGKEKTVILSTHIMQEVEAICDRVIIINKGKLVADDTTDNLQQRVKGSVAVRVEFKENVLPESLRKIKGVKSVKQEGREWTLYAEGKTDLREEISRYAKENSLTLLTLRVEESSLEDVFKQLTTNN